MFLPALSLLISTQRTSVFILNGLSAQDKGSLTMVGTIRPSVPCSRSYWTISTRATQTWRGALFTNTTPPLMLRSFAQALRKLSTEVRTSPFPGRVMRQRQLNSR